MYLSEAGCTATVLQCLLITKGFTSSTASKKQENNTSTTFKPSIKYVHQSNVGVNNDMIFLWEKILFSCKYFSIVYSSNMATVHRLCARNLTLQVVLQ